MGRELLVSESNLETVDCERVYSGVLHVEWC